MGLATLPTALLHAGTFISTNLPPGTTIVNISATQDGAAAYNSANSPNVGDVYQTYWYQPFNTGGQLLVVPVQAGTYTFRIINPATAASLFPSLASSQLSQIYTAWTYNSPWLNDYLVFNSTAASNPSEFQIFRGAVTPVAQFPGFSDATTSYSAAISGGYYNQIVTGPGGSYNGTTQTSYTFSQAGTIIFVVPDNILGDNTGGVSVLMQYQAPVTPSGVPEPSTAAMLAGPLAVAGGLAAVRRRRMLRSLQAQAR